MLGPSYFVPKIGTMQKSVFSPEYAVLRARLSDLRRQASLSQRDLAVTLGVPHTWVAKVESGERRIDLLEFARFCAACGVNAADVATSLFVAWDSSKSRGARRTR
jgi:transcriptional regulator with XRE-family HTH domain